MPDNTLTITKRRPDGTQIKIGYMLIPFGKLKWNATDKEKAKMLLEAEMNGNSSGKVRVHLFG